jgi:hypothetical protein
MAAPKTVLLPLELTSTAIEALELAQEELRTNPRLYHDVELMLAKLQRNRTGSLTDLLAALVGKE